MIWGSHPDTLTMAYAKGIADARSSDRASIGWLEAYRRAYADIEPEGQYSASAREALSNYLSRIDKRISELKCQS